MLRVRKAYQRCHRDIIGYQASKVVGSAKRHINQRISLLGQELGQDLDMERIAAEQRSKREADYEAYLLNEYNISREDAAKLMNEAMLSESKQFARGRSRRR